MSIHLLCIQHYILFQPNSGQTVWSTHYKPQSFCTTFHALGKCDMIPPVSQTIYTMPTSPVCLSGELLPASSSEPKNTMLSTNKECVGNKRLNLGSFIFGRLGLLPKKLLFLEIKLFYVTEGNDRYVTLMFESPNKIFEREEENLF